MEMPPPVCVAQLMISEISEFQLQTPSGYGARCLQKKTVRPPWGGALVSVGHKKQLQLFGRSVAELHKTHENATNSKDAKRHSISELAQLAEYA